ncbi:hypothetical protein DICVIV_02162 [Dictyocaulus viviparus]|uniref:DB module n=1 Tax=Dictyocaulus viviparus TaxID=29172 RepID=A0A0D8YAK4_DICVI|nr:hypothetical protein DICVIV_02162 [Dictyocaulus viviparus]
MLLSIVLFGLICFVRSQLIRECTCDEFEPCKKSTIHSVMQCADQCQSHITSLGASYPAARKCLHSKEDLLNAVMKCESAEFANACAKGPGGKVPKRYPETLRIAAYSELNAMLARSGIQNQAKEYMAAGKKFLACISRCSERGGGNCFKKLGCGLALPPDNVIVQTTKKCAIRNGFNTQAVQEMCHCMAKAGVRNLERICSKIQVS